MTFSRLFFTPRWTWNGSKKIAGNSFLMMSSNKQQTSAFLISAPTFRPQIVPVFVTDETHSVSVVSQVSKFRGWLITTIYLFLWLISLSCIRQVLAKRRQEGKGDGEKSWKLNSEWKVGSTPPPEIIARYFSPFIWFLSRGSLELNRLTQARWSILAGRALISRAKF